MFANNFCKQFGHRSGPNACRAWSGSKLFDILMVFLKEFFEKVGQRIYKKKILKPELGFLPKHMSLPFDARRFQMPCKCNIKLK